MRIFYLITLICSFSTTAAYADTVLASSRITHVKLHPKTAVIERTAEVHLEAGQHQVLISGLPLGIDPTSLTLDHPGLNRLSVSVRDDYPVRVSVASPEQEAAQTRVEVLEQRIRDVEHAAEMARLPMLAGQAEIDFLGQIGKRKGAGVSSVEDLQQMSKMISAQTQAAQAGILEARVQVQEIERSLIDLNKELVIARDALQALSLQSADRMFVALDVMAPQALDTTVTLSYLVQQQTQWTPAYDLRLDSADETLIFERSVYVSQNTGEDWTDVTLSLATASPSAQAVPSILYPRQVRIYDPSIAVAKSGHRLEQAALADVAVYELDTAAVEPYSVSEAGVTYSIPQKISVATGGGLVQLGLPPISVEASVTAQAVPLSDTKAYRMIEITNTSDQELLGSAQTRFYLGEELVGTGYFQGLVANATAKIGFGAIEGLQVTRAVLKRSEGEQGVISRSNQRVTQVEISVENLTGQNWPVRVLEGVPYSEQDDLEISWQATPSVSVKDLDNQRGILAWDLNVGAREAQKITLKTQIDWPDGFILQE